MTGAARALHGVVRTLPAAALAVIAALAGCGRGGDGRDGLLRVPPAPDGAWVRSAATAGGRVRVELADGRVLDLPERPRRIVSTLPNLTELVADLAGLSALVAVSPWCNHPPGVEQKPRLAVMPPDVERLQALAPDLVLCDATFQAASLDLLERHASAVLPVETRSVPHLRTTIDLLAQVLGTREARARARELLRRLDAAVAEVEAARPQPPPRVLLVGQADPLHVLGPGALLDDLLRITGCVNVAFDLGRASGPFSEEAVLSRAPDWILTTGDPLPDALRARWAGVPAVERGQVVEAWADDLQRPGPRTPAALRRLAGVLRGTLPPERLREPE